MTDASTGGLDPDDDQAVAEALDPELNDWTDTGAPADYPPDHALASAEARVVGPTGDVPLDSLEERLWREEPDVLPPADDERIELVEPHPGAGLDPDFEQGSLEEIDAVDDDGQLSASGLLYAPEDVPPAEEVAVHVVDDPDQFNVD